MSREIQHTLVQLLQAIALLLLLAGCAGVGARPASTGDTVAARKALARELVRRGDAAAAFPLVDGLYRQFPRDAEVLTLRGIVYRDQRMPREAEADFREALSIAPKDPLAHSLLGVLLDHGGRGTEALEHHRRAAELDPRNAGYLNNLGFSLLAHGSPRDAVPVLHEALRLSPTDGLIRNNLGFAYARTGDFRSAAEQFAMGGRPAEAKNNLAWAYQLAENFPRAVELYQEALQLEPGLASARANLIEASHRLGRPVPDVPEPPRPEKGLE
jgi:Flp pilus assembly protein TadD